MVLFKGLQNALLKRFRKISLKLREKKIMYFFFEFPLTIALFISGASAFKKFSRKIEGKDKSQLTVDISFPNCNDTEPAGRRCSVKKIYEIS